MLTPRRHHHVQFRGHWPAALTVCSGVLMVIANTTVVNLALPSIRADLAFTESTLVWVVNAYTLAFGGSLLVGSRLGDIYGRRALFLAGIALFTVASLACAIAHSRTLLIGGRAMQGMGGALILSVALSLLANLSSDRANRAKSLALYSFVGTGGGSIGLLLGGTVTSFLGWHWIFLVNLPIGAAVYVLSLSLIPKSAKESISKPDVLGGLAVTACSTLTIYSVLNGRFVGWMSVQMLCILAAATAALIAFLIIESRVAAPLVPLGVFRSRSVTVPNIIGVLWAVGLQVWFYFSTMYLQLVLDCDPSEVAIAFLPAYIAMALFSLGLSARLATRIGTRWATALGMAVSGIGLALLSRARVSGTLITDVLPGMTLLGIGTGISLTPLFLSAMNGFTAEQSGLASGIINSSRMLGGALGLGVLVSVSDARTSALLTSGVVESAARAGGYGLALALGAMCAFAGAVISITLSTSANGPSEAVERP